MLNPETMDDYDVEMEGDPFHGVVMEVFQLFRDARTGALDPRALLIQEVGDWRRGKGKEPGGSVLLQEEIGGARVLLRGTYYWSDAGRIPAGNAK
jgi:hypothetical protein